MPIKLDGRLPSDRLNGLTVLEERLTEKPKDTYVIVAIVSAGQTTEDNDTGEVTVKAKVRQIEAITATGDAGSARRILTRATEDRMGVRAIEGLDQILDDWSRMETITHMTGTAEEAEKAAEEDEAETDPESGFDPDDETHL